MLQQRLITGEVDPAAICGTPSWRSPPRPSGVTWRVNDAGWDFCCAPRTPHAEHPLARCFRKATPCQVMLLAPWARDVKTCLADTLEHFLEALPKSEAYWRRVLVDQQPRALPRDSLDYWMRLNAV